MKAKNILYIDTSDNRITKVSLDINGKKKKISRETINFSSQALLPLISDILRLNNRKFTDISEIRLDTGPGSFTGIRVGIAVANTLGWFLGIPVNGKKQVEPVYK